MQANIARLAEFSSSGQPSGYAASDMMRSDVESLVVEITTLRQQLEVCIFDRDTYKTHLDRRTHQLAEANKDAERMNWLSRNVYVGITVRNECLWSIKGLFDKDGCKFDAAIDAAIAKEKTE